MQFIAWLGSGVWYLPSFVFVLGVIIFVHEMGHFLVARWCNVAVEAFSIGFGPELIGRVDRRGTRWKVCAVPLGGYVKFAGDENAGSVPNRAALAAMSEAERRTSFYLKPVWQRAAVVAAGPAANFLLAVVIFALFFMISGRPSIDASIDEVIPGSPAAEAGFQPGDVILAIDGSTVRDFNDVVRRVTGEAGTALDFTVRRGEATVDLVATPRMTDMTDEFNNKYSAGMLGVKRTAKHDDVTREYLGPVAAVGAAVEETAFITTRTVDVVVGIVTGHQSIDQLGGPIRVAKVSGEMASLGVDALFAMIAMLSVSIGLVNLLPIPILDGGHLMFYAIEAARGRPLSERAQDVGFRIGLTLVFILMVFVTLNDTRERIGAFIGSVS